MCAASAFVGYSYYENQLLADTTTHLLEHYNSNYVIQNLQGTVVNTWVSWNLIQGQTLHVSIVNDANLPEDKITAIKDAILSNGTITVDDSLLHEGPQGTSSTRYKGWEGALANLQSLPTKFYIPQSFAISEGSNGAGDVVITLTNDENPDGLSGYTKSISDGNQILKSKITIYQSSQLSAMQLGAITRHEFGHALGLAHSTDPSDLMHATIRTDYPYISGCDIDAIKGLYSGDERSQVMCQ
ncbi:MAG: matrixin family metalloprotease [Thaumarchaeota archaeon]|nr:matrixin family metalloprotease [Nitrososphaerota archaeon]